MRKAIVFMLAAGLLIVYGCGKQDIGPLRSGPSFTAIRTDTPPAVDGILTDECWEKCEPFTLESPNESARKLPTTVRMAWDAENLYIGFECQDTDAASTIAGRDAPVSSQECVSVYIDADADTVSYVIIDIAPTGAVYDAFVLDRNGGDRKILPSWNCEGLRTSVSVYGGGAAPGTEDRFWTVEILLPLKEFYTASSSPPLEGDAWRFNVHRQEMTGGRSVSSLVPAEKGGGPGRLQFAWLIFGG